MLHWIMNRVYLLFHNDMQAWKGLQKFILAMMMIMNPDYTIICNIIIMLWAL